MRFGESRESTNPLQPTEALFLLEKAVQNGTKPELLELVGPGDPLADPARTFETLDMVRRKYPGIPVAIKTLGIGGEELADSLFSKGVTQATLQVDAVDPEVARSLYSWIRPGKKTLSLERAVSILMDEQERTLRSFHRAGMRVTVRTTVYPGYNDKHITRIACRMAELGAEAMMIVPCVPQLEETGFLTEPVAEMMDLLHAGAAKYIRIVDGQEGCREVPFPETPEGGQSLLTKPTRERPNLAVVSSNGMDIDLHLGQAIKVLIYGPREDGLPCLLEARDLPEPGGGDNRWLEAAGIMNDCFVLLASSTGQRPRDILGEQGLPVLLMEDNVEGAVDALFGGGKKGKRKNL